MSNEQNKLVVFQEKQIRRVWHNEEWWFSIIDVIAVLTESKNPQNYWYTMKNRLKSEGAGQTLTICKGLKMVAQDGRHEENRLCEYGNDVSPYPVYPLPQCRTV